MNDSGSDSSSRSQSPEIAFISVSANSVCTENEVMNMNLRVVDADAKHFVEMAAIEPEKTDRSDSESENSDTQLDPQRSLFKLCKKPNSLEKIKYLVETEGVSVFETDDQDKTPLILACEYSDENVVKYSVFEKLGLVPEFGRFWAFLE